MARKPNKKSIKKRIARRQGTSSPSGSDEQPGVNLHDMMSSPNKLQELKGMIARMLPGGAAFSDDMLSGGSLPEFSVEALKPRSKKSEQRLEKWDNWARDFQSSVFPQFSHQQINYSVTFDLLHVGSDGVIVGVYEVENESYRFFVKLDPEASQPRAGCECMASMGRNPCIHTFTFSDWLYEMVLNPDCEVHDIIADNDFTPGQADLGELLAIDSKTIQNFLQHHIPAPTKTNKSLQLPDASVLDEVSTTTAPRLCWELTDLSYQPVYKLRVQQPKKRGSGFTKGKRVTSSSLLSAMGLADDIDRKIISRLPDHQLYYGSGVEFPVSQTSYDLIGKDNVTIDGKPAKVEKFRIELEYFESDDQCGVKIKTPFENLSPTFLASNEEFLTMISIGTNQILVDKAAPEVISTVKATMGIPPLPLEASEALIEHLENFQAIVPIELPTTKTKIEPEQTRCVLLLRSRDDGALDYGVRLRGSHGDLYKPGHGPLIVSGASATKTTGGKKSKKAKTYKVRRSPQAELSQAQQFLEQLGLPEAETDGTLSDFEKAIELLELTQELESNQTIEVLWDKASVEPVKVLGAITPKNLQVKVGQSRDWLQLRGQADLQFGSLDLSDLISGLDSSNSIGDYVKFGDKGWAKISRRLRRQLTKVSDSVHRDRKQLKFDATSVPALKEILSENTNFETSKQWDQCVARMESANQLQPVVPSGLQADLRSYQEEGFCWLRRLAEWQVGGILADDMGLGKTLQALAVTLDRSSEGPALIVAPTSVGFNWQSEAERFAPELNVHLYRESNRKELLQNVAAGDVVICSYGLLLRDQELLCDVDWSTLVLDEAQAIKNSRSKTAIAAKAIPAKWKVALTGTPMENHLGELWSIFHVVAPGVFGGWENFRKRFALPIERDQDESRRTALRERIQPFVLRRKKSEVLHDLPPRDEQNIVIELSAEERKIYDAARATALLETDEIAGLTDIKDQRFRLLALLTRLRQLACSPKMVDSKFTARSSKLNQLADTLQQLKSEGHRVLIFSQFVKHLHLIRDMLTEEEISFEYLDGSTNAKSRKQSVARFQEGDTTAFLISLKAGGTGLNLTAADYVIHMDPWWNPAVEDQATDRAHRIGQQNSVMCYRFVAKNTIEEEILKLHASKRDLVAGVLEGSASAGKLSTEDLIALIRNQS